MRTISFPFRIDANGHLADTSNTKKIWTDRVRAVVNTQVGDRVMRPDFGTDTDSLVLDVGTPAQKSLPDVLKGSLGKFLPQLQVDDVVAYPGENSQTVRGEVRFTCPDRTFASTTVTLEDGNVTSELDPYETDNW